MVKGGEGEDKVVPSSDLHCGKLPLKPYCSVQSKVSNDVCLSFHISPQLTAMTELLSRVSSLQSGSWV